MWASGCVWRGGDDWDVFGGVYDDVWRCVWVCGVGREGRGGCGRGRILGRKSPGPWTFWQAEAGFGRVGEKVPRSMGLAVWVARMVVELEDGVATGGKKVEMWVMDRGNVGESPPVHGMTLNRTSG